MDEEELKKLLENLPPTGVLQPPPGYPYFTPPEQPQVFTPEPPLPPEEALQKLALKPEEELRALAPPQPTPQEVPPPVEEPVAQAEPAPPPEPITGLVDPFASEAEQAQQAREAASARTARAAQPVGGRPPGKLTYGLEHALPGTYSALDEFAKLAFEESQKAAEANPEFDPSVPLKAAQVAINPTAALVTGAIARGVPEVLETVAPAPKPTPPMSKVLADMILGPAYAEGIENVAPTSVARQLPQGLTPTASRIVQTVGGPAEVNQSDLYAMGVIGATTLGMAFLPQVYRALKFNITPRLRPVTDAAPGTMAISRPGDLGRTYDDVTAGALRLAGRAGVDADAVERLEQTFRIQSRNGARALADSVVQTGRMETPSFKFGTPVALTTLQQRMTPEAQQYLLLRDTQDQLNIMSQQQQFQPSATRTVGVPMVAGKTLPDVHAEMFALEQAHPEVVQISKDYNAHVKAVRDFESTGEYATRPKANPNIKNPAAENRSTNWLNSQRPNEVPFKGERSLGMALESRDNPIGSQAYNTRIAVRSRLENEAVGSYVDEIRKKNPDLFVKVSTDELSYNPEWKKNTVSFYRRGELEHYTTDPFLADVFKMDPYYMTGMIGQALYATKRIMEFGSTGLGAPAFAPISMLRNWQIAKYTAEQGFRSPSLLGSLTAIPRQLLPQLGKTFSNWLDSGSGQWLSKTFPAFHLDALGQRLAYEFDNSLYQQLKAVGSSKGSILEQQIQSKALNAAHAKFMALPTQVRAPVQAFWDAWHEFWGAMHNAPAYDFVRKNLKVEPLPQLASRARALTGDPRVGGQYYTYTAGGAERAIRFESDSRVTHTAAKALQYGYGVPMELMRDSIPWFNATLQGAKRIGQAYLDNPLKFTTRTWMYAGAPAASLYFYTRSLGNDPHGVSYVDYMLNRRSAYNRQMNWYFPIPGRPAEDGIEFPFFHELAPFKRMMEIGLDHAFRSDSKFANTNSQDFWNAAHAFLDTAVIPPMPPVGGVLMASQGMVAPQGVFGGEAYKKKDDPFDQTGGLPSSLELYARALGGGIGNTLGQAYAAYSQTPEGFWNGISNASKAALRTQITRAPILRDITGIKAPITGNTDVSRMLFEKQNEINQLTKYFQRWDKFGKNVGPGEIDVTPKSKGGGLVTDYLLGPGFSPASPGIGQPEPTNPLYVRFMEDVYNRFRKESPLPSRKGEDEGGIGFGSLWRRYGDSTEKLSRLRNINEGNYNTWQEELAKDPRALKEIKDGGADPTDLRQVKNFYERKRFDAARTILYMIRAVENDFSQQLGRPITLKDIDPYKQGLSGQAPAPSTASDLTGFP